MTEYTLAAHSGLGTLAVESCALRGTRDARAVTAAGGVLFDTYGQAEYVAEAVLRYVGNGICPVGVAGGFAELRVHGLPVWVPDAWARTLLTLAAENGYALPVERLVELVDAVLAAPGG